MRNSGWENENKYLTILDFGIASLLSAQVQSDIASHQEDISMHPYGKLSLNESNADYIRNKLLKNDMSNIDASRTTTFFPQEVVKLDIGNVIMHGY